VARSEMVRRDEARERENERNEKFLHLLIFIVLISP